jgi:hypothetical protein
LQFLELLLQDELNVRAQRRLERRKKAAGFHDLKPLEDFDWTFNPSFKRSQIFDLATGQFIRQHRDVLLSLDLLHANGLRAYQPPLVPPGEFPDPAWSAAP